MPNGLIYISDDSNGAYDPETSVWTIGDLAKGDSVTLKIETLVDARDTYINNPVVVSSDTYDPDKSNNRANSTIKVISSINTAFFEFSPKLRISLNTS